MAKGLKSGVIQEIDDDEVDYELSNPNAFFGSHVNLIPMQSAIQAPRLFYGARFYNQALPLASREAPLVQTLMHGREDEGHTFDAELGKHTGAMYADEDGEVVDVSKNHITYKDAAGKKKNVALYNNFPFNRKSAATQTATLKHGDTFKAGQLMATSNYTDKEGKLALGMNARIGLVPYKGWSMDDALAVSESFAKRMISEQAYTKTQDFDDNTKGGLKHFVSLFPDAFKKDQLEKMDEDGVIKVGQKVKPGDPFILATVPKVVTSADANVGKLSRTLQQSRKNATQLWDYEDEGEVVDVTKGKGGVKVLISSLSPTKKGDKVVLRSGQKNIISKIIPDDQMLRTTDGKPLDVLLNPLGIPSRVNNGLIYELLLGKVAEKNGAPVKVSGFNKTGEKWYDFVKAKLDEAGLPETEDVFDPTTNKKLQQPITVGVGHMLKLHHVAECFDEQTEVLTDEGWKFWRDVKETDLLATSDTHGGTLYFEKPLHILKYKYVGELFGFKGRYVDYLVTPNHNMWCKYYHGSRAFGLKPAAEVHGKRFVVKAFGLKSNQSSSEIFKLGVREFNWDDFAEFVGWWVTEGCVGSNKCSVLIYQSSTANPEKLKRIEVLAEKLKLNWTPYKASGVKAGICVNDKELANYFKNYGEHCILKRIPREFIKGNLSGLTRLVDAMLLGDGSTQQYKTSIPGLFRTTERLCTTSLQLANDFQEACIRLGRTSFLNQDAEDWKKYKENPHFHLAYNVSSSTCRMRLQVDGDRNLGGFYKQAYNGYVYCAEMPSGLLYVRRNGKPMLSGNSKTSARGVGSYDINQQPAKGGGAGAQAKRLSGLESNALLSAGAYHTLREGATLRGQQNDEYWRQLRLGQKPPTPGSPFVWHKFKTLLNGAGLHAKEIADGRLRLGPMTDKVLDSYNPVEIKNGEVVNLNTLEPVAGGLFDPALVGGQRTWGKVTLPFSVPNPAFEESARTLLGLTKKEFEAVLAGKMDIPHK